MRKTALLSTIILLSVAAIGQETEKRTFSESLSVRLEAGYSIPLNNRPEDPEDAVIVDWESTKNGLLFDLSFDYKFPEDKVGLTLSYKHIRSQMDLDYLNSSFSSQGSTASITSDLWKLNAIMIGGFYQIPTTKSLTFRTGLEIGVLNTTSPKTTINYTSPSSTYEIGEGNSLTFAAQPKVNLFYNFNPNWQMNAFGSLLVAPTEITIEENLNGNDLGQSTKTSNIQALNIGLGITYSF